MNRYTFLLLTFVLSIWGQGLSAQSEGICPAVIDQALAGLATNCDDMARNQACYGHNNLLAQFTDAQPDDFFNTPSDRADLPTLRSIQTMPLDAQTSEWGIAMMNVQANVPGGLPGQAAIFMLFGDAEVTNMVDPEAAFMGADPVTATVLAAANGRSGPGVNYNVVIAIPRGALLQADALSTDGNWVRAAYEGRSLWISRDLVQPEVTGSLAALPAISATTQTPMQAIQLRTGFGATECLDVPSALVVQGPDNVHVNITVNGADIQIGSTIVLYITPQNYLRLITASGSAYVDGITVPAGFTIEFKLTEDGTDMAEAWSGFRPMTSAELQALRWVEQIPVDILHYEIVLPTMGQVMQTNAAFGRAAGTSNTAGSTGSTTPENTVTCAGFVQTSPLQAAAVGNHTFYWDPTSGADTYRWILQDAQGNYLSVLDTRQTNITVDLLSTYPSDLVWAVEALADNQIICSTAYLPIQLLGGGQQTSSPAAATEEELCLEKEGYWDSVEEYCYPAYGGT